MVRWRYCLVLAVLLLLPLRTYEADEEEEDDDGDNNEEVEDEDDDNEADDQGEKPSDRDKASHLPTARRSLTILVTSPPIVTATNTVMTRTAKKRPLECYVCAYKAEAPLRACLDPSKYRVHTITCHSVDDKCFTTTLTKGSHYEAVVRGCRTGCTGTPDTTCCEMNRCNEQAFVVPVAAQQRALAAHAGGAAAANKTGKPIPQTVLFFVTVLLVLQTVVKVAFI